ncbi:hypothetical protein BKA67DRAFT_642781 [Truncatella angustata]|uniref:Uncharacterized protein n=1 Tax=Truncatella angustata TaxID=152316 RepID=A0A9P8ZZX4_9PEZI|nr:uncharacterized protein BKA67DRAFT_642781 [Truncatella angustata]KAH6656673.1 hypothetical protein BKA67DRAFT_642781 [Truncatella angustata]
MCCFLVLLWQPLLKMCLYLSCPKRSQQQAKRRGKAHKNPDKIKVKLNPRNSSDSSQDEVLLVAETSAEASASTPDYPSSPNILLVKMGDASRFHKSPPLLQPTSGCNRKKSTCGDCHHNSKASQSPSDEEPHTTTGSYDRPRQSNQNWDSDWDYKPPSQHTVPAPAPSQTSSANSSSTNSMMGAQLLEPNQALMSYP